MHLRESRDRQKAEKLARTFVKAEEKLVREKFCEDKEVIWKATGI